MLAALVAEGYTIDIKQTNHMTATFTVPQENTFNGWANYETWNVSLWINNDEGMYRLARIKGHSGYDHLIPALEVNFGQMTPDGVRWMDPRIDTDEMDEMLEELCDMTGY